MIASFCACWAFFGLFGAGEHASESRWSDLPDRHDAVAFEVAMSALLTNSLTNTLSLTCEDIGTFDFTGVPTALLPADTTYLEYGIPSAEELILNVNATIVEPISQVPYAIQHVDVLSQQGLPADLSATLPFLPLPAQTQACIPLEGTPLETGLFELEVLCNVVISVFGNPFTLGNFTFNHWVRVLPNTSGIPGCVYSWAGNFDPLATLDDGSCLEPGCTDVNALNFSASAAFDNGSCVYGDNGGNAVCPEDLNGDGAINTGDLLALLSVFGSPCE
jgi:hypothetical protein